VRFCGNNTGNEGQDKNWGETICITDGTLAQALANTATPEAQYYRAGQLGLRDDGQHRVSARAAAIGLFTKTAMVPRSGATTISGHASKMARTQIRCLMAARASAR
jgi:hypothetical protein